MSKPLAKTELSVYRCVYGLGIPRLTLENGGFDVGEGEGGVVFEQISLED